MPLSCFLFLLFFFLNIHSDFHSDFVTVYDGEDPETAHILGGFSGEIIPSDVFSSTGVMLVTFETDIGIAAEVFLLFDLFLL